MSLFAPFGLFAALLTTVCGPAPGPTVPLAPRVSLSQHAPAAFDVVHLGVKGGLDESNLSAYLVAPSGHREFLCLDAGTISAGVGQAIRHRALRGPADVVIRRQIRAYCISHPHVDHVAGLLLNAPDDTAKSVYGLPECLAVLQRDYFNWQAWPNFGDAGPAPSLRKYQLRALSPGQEVSVPGTALSVGAFPLSHGPGYQSTAFLVRHEHSYLLYLGDTGADELEHSQRLRELWQAMRPLLTAGQLRGIFIEVSYPNEQPENQLFGHLTPARLLQELGVLSQLTGPAALRGFPIVVTHIKPTGANEATIRRQLTVGNTLGLRLIFPRQGRRIKL